MVQKQKTNPLSYLGWLGIIGIIGINTGDYLLQMFLVYFVFFIYKHMPADELFWKNVKNIGFKAFIVEVLFSSTAIIALVILNKIKKLAVGLNTLFHIYALGIFLILCFFIVSLLYINRQEQKYMED